jgi:hypothetical protein
MWIDALEGRWVLLVSLPEDLGSRRDVQHRWTLLWHNGLRLETTRICDSPLAPETHRKAIRFHGSSLTIIFEIVQLIRVSSRRLLRATILVFFFFDHCQWT